MKPTILADMIFDRSLHKTSPEDTVRTACIIMSAANVGALPVVDKNGDLVGIVSERDVIQRSVIVYRPSEETPVKQIMTPNPQWLPLDANTTEAVQVMRNGRFRHLPVCEGTRVVGMVSIRDFDLQTCAMNDQNIRVSATASGSKSHHFRSLICES